MLNIEEVNPRALLRGRSRHIRGIGAEIDKLTFRGEDFRAKVSSDILDVPITRTVEGASSLSVVCADPDWRLLNSKLLEATFDVELDGLGFTFVGPAFDTDAGTTTLKFEDREVHAMRSKPGQPDKADRDDVTRAEFCAVRFARNRVPLFCPALHVVQPIKDAKAAREDTVTRDQQRQPALGADASKLKVKGVPANAEQIKNGDTVMRVGDSLGAPRLALVAAIMAGTQENNMMESTNDGFFAMTAATRASTGIAQGDLAAAANWAYKVGWHAGLIESINNGLAPGDAAQQMEGSRYPTLYAQWQSQGEEWVAAFYGGSISGGNAGGTVTSTTDKAYKFEQGADETDWDCVGRLADEVKWRRFVANGIGYLIAEPDLFASRARLMITPDTPGIDKISGDNDSGKRFDELTITGRARAFAAPPGTVVIVDGLGEQVNGRYLVKQIDGNGLSPDFSATIGRAQKPLPEPAPETTTKTVGGAQDQPSGSTDDQTSNEEGVGTYDGKQVAKWIIPWLEKSKAAGWNGTVSSGYRTPAYSESLCFNMCGAPTCPGTCAGASSNHSGTKYPAGAVDVTDYGTFGAIQPKIGSPLKNDLPADPVHFSVSGH